MQYRGSCHCGKVGIEVEGEIQGAFSCNCSICSRRGTLLWFAPRERLRCAARRPHHLHVQQARDPAPVLQALRHPALRVGQDPPGQPMAAINIRCLEDFEFDKVPVMHYRRPEGLTPGSTLIYMRRRSRGFRASRLGAFAAHALKAGLAPECSRCSRPRALPDVPRVRAGARRPGAGRAGSGASSRWPVAVHRRHPVVLGQPVRAGVDGRRGGSAPVTPVGGLAFLAGWLALVVVLRAPPSA